MIKEEILGVFKILSGKANRTPNTTFSPPLVVISQHNHNYFLVFEVPMLVGIKDYGGELCLQP